MNLSQWLWLSTAAYGIHILEEFAFDWRNWARAVIRLPVEWTDFYITNALVIVLGVSAVNLADAAPGIALAFPALMLINAVFFHILPVAITKGRFSPGLITAVLLFFPVAGGTFWVAHTNGILTTNIAATAFAIGASLMATPIVFLRLRGRPYFQQT